MGERLEMQPDDRLLSRREEKKNEKAWDRGCLKCMDIIQNVDVLPLALIPHPCHPHGSLINLKSACKIKQHYPPEILNNAFFCDHCT